MKTCIYIWSVIFLSAVAAQTVDESILQYFHNPKPHITLKPRITTEDRIAGHGYPAETHRTITEDGYIITMFRIPYSHKLQNSQEYRPIVLIQHGVFSCSDGWIANGPDDSIAFMLADAGYDVWIGNCRGTTYSRNHTTRSTNHPYFWRFSWHEIGLYDLTAIIDYILVANGQGQKAIHYVGHSQGTTTLFVLLSLRPEYNAKIKTAHMLSPVAYMTHTREILIRRLSFFLGRPSKYTEIIETQEFVPYNELFIKLGYNVCHPDSKLNRFCNEFATWINGEDGNFNVTAFDIIGQTHPSGCSTSQILHYTQLQQSGSFRQYDHGIAKNKKKYGQPTPPDYPVHLITAELHLWYGQHDAVAAVEDVERFAALLPNKVMHRLEDPTWNHIDFLVHMQLRRDLNEPIIEIMQNYENNH